MRLSEMAGQCDGGFGGGCESLVEISGDAHNEDADTPVFSCLNTYSNRSFVESDKDTLRNLPLRKRPTGGMRMSEIYHDARLLQHEGNAE